MVEAAKTYTPSVHEETFENLKAFLASGGVSGNDPKDGSYWMPVKDSGYYILARYYGPTSRINGKTAKDITFKGTKLERKFETVKFE